MNQKIFGRNLAALATNRSSSSFYCLSPRLSFLFSCSFSLFFFHFVVVFVIRITNAEANKYRLTLRRRWHHLHHRDGCYVSSTYGAILCFLFEHKKSDPNWELMLWLVAHNLILASNFLLLNKFYIKSIIPKNNTFPIRWFHRDFIDFYLFIVVALEVPFVLRCNKWKDVIFTIFSFLWTCKLDTLNTA